MSHELEESKSSTRVDTWVDNERVTLVLVGSSIIEHEGELVSGIGLSVRGAIELAHTLLGYAMKIEDEKVEE